MKVAIITGGTMEFDLDAITDQLEIVADWRDDLRARINRAVLVFLYDDVDADLDALAAEVASFRRVCACLAWRDKDWAS
jgi:hypothetical protein